MPTEAEITAAAKAMYKCQLDNARRHLDSLAFDPSDVDQFVTKLLKESPTAQVLIFYSYLDDRVQNILALQMRYLQTNESRDRVFGVNGPLETFSSRILIAYHLGWLSDDRRRRLDAFRKVRNAFAHNAFKLSLTDPIIRSHLATIDHRPTGVYDRISSDPLNADFSPTLLSDLVTLTIDTFRELLLNPIAIAHHVNAHDIVQPREEQPALMKKVEHILIKSLLMTGKPGYIQEHT